MPTRKKRRITAEDLYRFEVITDCQLAPDGRSVIYSLQRVDRKTEKKYSNLWIVPTSGGPARPFTSGNQVDASPRWSPDGARIAFLSKRGDDKFPQIYLIPFDGGEARRLTDLEGEIASLEWSPDGAHFVLQFRRQDLDAAERETDEQKKKLGVVARRITRTWFKLDGTGFLPQERWHIWTIDARTGKARQLTHGAVHDEIEPSWSPDGKSIAFMSNRAEDPDLSPEEVELFVMSLGGRLRKIDTPFGFKNLPSFSPDGKSIAYLATQGRSIELHNTDLFVVPADGKGKAHNLTRKLDVHVDSYTIADMGSLALMRPTWSSDGQTLYFQVVRHGNAELRSIPVKGGPAQAIIADPGVVGAYSFDRYQSKLAYFFGELTDPGQVRLRDTASGQTRTLTRINRALLDSLDLGQVEEVWFKGGNDNDLQGWIIRPPGFRPSKKYPSILYIHGGPLLQYGSFFMHEFFYHGAHGYVVYFCNPRGGRGYGEKHAQACRNAWGTADYDDLMAWADFVAGKPYIDRKRMGVAGGSYGGYMTNWITGHTHRFAAASTQRSICNFTSMWGSSDFNWNFQELVDDLPPWENIDRYWEMSPMKYVGNVKTPTLITHSEQDLRCVIEQAEQWFVALKRLGVPVEMVRFPDEPHGLSRNGRTDRRIERLNLIRNWFDQYLKKV